MEAKRFSESEIPYNYFNEWGLTQEMIDDLPEPIMDCLLAGKETPVLPLKLHLNNGEIVIKHGRLQIVSINNVTKGKILLAKKTTELNGFQADEQNALRGGKVIPVTFDGENVFAQLDDRTNRVMIVSQNEVIQNIKALQKELEGLSEEEKNTLLNGEPVTYSKDAKTYTAGIDLGLHTAVDIIEGDSEAWGKALEERNIEQYSFGIYGCWIADDEGQINSYVNENDYTPDLLEKQIEAGEKNARELRYKTQNVNQKEVEEIHHSLKK